MSSQVKGCVNEGFTESYDNKSTNKCDINPLSQINTKINQKERSRNKMSFVSFDQKVDENWSEEFKTDKLYGRLRKISAPIFGSKPMKTRTENRRASEAAITIKPNLGLRQASVLILPIPEDYKNLDDESLSLDIDSPNSSKASSLMDFPFKRIEVSLDFLNSFSFKFKITQFIA